MENSTLMRGDTIFFLIDCITLVPLIFISSILYIVWNVYFVKKIILFTKAHSQALEKARYDILGNYKQLADNHKIEVVKYSFLLTINIVEVLGFIAYAISVVASDIITDGRQPSFPDYVQASNCTKDFVSGSSIQRISTLIPIIGFCEAAGQVAILLTLALCICLIKYLRSCYYEKGGEFKWIFWFMLLTSFICVNILIFSAVPPLMIFHRIIEPFFQVIYFVLFVRHVRLFHHTLKRQTIDLKIINKPKSAIQTSIRLVRQFDVISTLNSIAIACFIFADFLPQYSFVISIALYFGPCFSEYAYGRVFYQPPLVDADQVNKLNMAIIILNWIANIAVAFACICIFSHYFFISITLFGSKVLQDLRMRFGIRVYRTPIIRQPLLE